MAILMLASTVSWTIEKHFCSGSLVDIAFFQEAEGCCVRSVTGQDLFLAAIDDDSCCSDELISIEGLDGLTFPHKDQAAAVPLFFVASTLYGHIWLVAPDGGLLPLPKNYPPPLLVRDVHVLNEVYLI